MDKSTELKAESRESKVEKIYESLNSSKRLMFTDRPRLYYVRGLVQYSQIVTWSNVVLSQQSTVVKVHYCIYVILNKTWPCSIKR